LEGIKVKPYGGSQPDFSPEARARIVELARTPPQELGLAFGNWSLRILVWYLVQKEKLVSSISYEGVRVILREQGLRFQKSRLVAEPHDPEYEVKKGLLISF
jgi:transposase